MAEYTVLKEQLRKEMIEAGAQLTAELDSLRLPIVAALWLFSSETNEWRLTFATGDVAKLGPKKIYELISRARDQVGSLAEEVPLEMISVLDENNQQVRQLRTAIGTGPGISRIRFTKNSINGHFIDDALIYRIV